MESLRVRILDHEYLVRTEENEEQVNRIARFVNERLQEIRQNTQGLSEKKMAIMAAFNIASDYFQLQKEWENFIAEMGGRTTALIRHIDSSAK